MINALRLLIFAFSLIFLAMAFALPSVESEIIDFTKIPIEELRIFQVAFYLMWIATMLIAAFYGGDDY